MNEIIQNCGDKSMQNKTRLAQIKSFLEKNCGLKKYKILSMGFDASSRKYFRILKDNGKTDVLVDDEGCKNHSKEFVIIAKFLLKNGIRAPKIRAKDLKKGLMLIEDFGESDFVKVADGKNDKELLRKAVDVLINKLFWIILLCLAIGIFRLVWAKIWMRIKGKSFFIWLKNLCPKRLRCRRP